MSIHVPIRVAIAGMGAMGRLYAKWLQQGLIPGAVFSAGYDPSPTAIETLRLHFSQAEFYTSSAELFASGKADMVIIAAPHLFHPQLGEEALRAGLHTLVEKPAGIEAADVQKMNRTAAENPHLVYGVMFNQRTNPLYCHIRELVQSGNMGRLRRVVWHVSTWWRPDAYYTSSPWRATWAHEGGGLLTSQAPHQLDLLQWICGMPERVCCHMQFGAHRSITVEDDVTAYLEFKGGATGVFISCTHDVLGTDQLELLLDGGKILVEDGKRAVIRKLYQPEQYLSSSLGPQQTARLVEGGSLQDIYTESTIEHSPDWAEQHCTALAEFIEAIRTGKPFFAPGEEGLNEVRLANAMYLSAWQNRTVHLPVSEAQFHAALVEQIQAEERKKATRKE